VSLFADESFFQARVLIEGGFSEKEATSPASLGERVAPDCPVSLGEVFELFPHAPGREGEVAFFFLEVGVGLVESEELRVVVHIWLCSVE